MLHPPRLEKEIEVLENGDAVPFTTKENAVAPSPARAPAPAPAPAPSPAKEEQKAELVLNSQQVKRRPEGGPGAPGGEVALPFFSPYWP